MARCCRATLPQARSRDVSARRGVKIVTLNILSAITQGSSSNPTLLRQLFSNVHSAVRYGRFGFHFVLSIQVYADTGYFAESLGYLRQVAQSGHPRHHVASVQLGAAYASQGKHELATGAYKSVLVERPHHAAALAGLAEAAYWRDKSAVASALAALRPAVDKAAQTWTDDAPAAPLEDEDEGEDATDFHRVQLLMQWATLSRMEKKSADFACVALPLVTVALGQVVQRQEFEMRKALPVVPGNVRETSGGGGVRAGKPATKPGSENPEHNLKEEAEEGEGGGAVNDKDSRERPRALVWKPGPVRPIVGKLDWQAGLRGQLFTLMLRLLQSTDVIVQVGRRAIFWHVVELVRCLLELGNPKEAAEVVAAAIRPDGFLRGLEKEDLRSVLANPDKAVLATMPGGSPIHGPATRENLLLGPASTAKLVPEADRDASAVVPSSEQHYPPPWRCVEEKDDDGMSGRVRSWRPNSRGSQGGSRRSRSRTLMELAERKNDGDAICALVRALSRTPGNNATWNLLQRVATEHGVETADGGFHGEQVEALVARHRERVQGLLYRAHDATTWNRSKQALKLYSQAHAARPDDALPILCLGTHTIRMVTVMETMVDHDGVCILQALACLHRYAELRKGQFAAGGTGSTTAGGGSKALEIPEAVLDQEVMYNLGRGYHHVGRPELAIEYYNRALRVEDERGHELRDWSGGGGVTKETAHNLCTLYKRVGATAMALRILNKYLSIG